MPKTVILGSARTPIGKLGGGLSTLKATELGGVAISAALERADVEPEQVGHVVMGQVLQAGQGQIPSRQAQIKAGIPKEVSSVTINKVCASGLRATVILDQAIRAGDVEVGVGGGMESMSKAPYVLPQARFGYRMGDAKMLDPMVNDGGGALVVASDEWAQANGKEALAEVVAHAQSANDFAYLATTPASAAQKALEKAGLTAQDIDVWEINEAFASVTLNSIRLLGIDEGKVNVNGGAVALGHPIGASGARILGALVHELRRRGGGLGCAAICSGGGQGDAVILRV